MVATAKHIQKASLDCRLDVLVEAEQVCWIVLVFQRNQSFTHIGSVGGLYHVIAFVTGVVNVDGLCQKRLHRFPVSACPANVFLGLCAIGPFRCNEKVIGQIWMSIGRRIPADSTDGATAIVLNEYHGLW